MTRIRLSSEKTISEDWNAVFEGLAAEPRRQIITGLLDVPEEQAVSLPDAADPPFWDTDQEQLSVALVHSHLPKLEQHGFIEWSRDPFVARRGPRFEDAAIVFESLYRNVDRIPQRLVDGCPGLEEKRTENRD